VPAPPRSPLPQLSPACGLETYPSPGPDAPDNVARIAADPVRTPLQSRDYSSRPLDQRLFVRFPRLAAANARLVSGLEPRSRLRRWAYKRAAELALAAYNRRDLQGASAAFHPDLEYYPYREFVEGGLTEPVYRGPAGYRAYIESTYEVWGAGVRVEPTELIDLGDRLVILGNMPMRAQASGIPLAEKYGTVATLRDGLVVRQQDFLQHD
jgi:ketosteroid isomerase-like protein